MPLRMTATGVTEIGRGIWSFEMPPHQVRHFGSTNHAIGPQSVLMFRSYAYDADQQQLHFDLEDVAPINVGTTPRAIGIAARGDEEGTALPSIEGSPEPSVLGPGDREFLQLPRSELSEGTARAAERLLLGVRQKFAGNLKRGQARNFSETPDNFWYVIVQPRADELSIPCAAPSTASSH